METLHIARVRVIAKGKSIDGVARKVNIVVLDVTGGKPSIVRNFTQFLQDLKNSFLIDESVGTINHPAVRTVLKGLKRGMVSGEIVFPKKGDKWTVTENSRCITDPTHAKYNKVSVGDVLISESTTPIVDGFLDIETNEQFQTVEAIANATASAKMALAGAFEDFGVSTDAPETVVDELPAEVMEEVLATGSKKK